MVEIMFVVRVPFIVNHTPVRIMWLPEGGTGLWRVHYYRFKDITDMIVPEILTLKGLPNIKDSILLSLSDI